MKCAVALLNDLATARPHYTTHKHTEREGEGQRERGHTTHARTPNLSTKRASLLGPFNRQLSQSSQRQPTGAIVIVWTEAVAGAGAVTGTEVWVLFSVWLCATVAAVVVVAAVPHRIQRCKYAGTSLQFVLESDHSCAEAVLPQLLCVHVSIPWTVGEGSRG